MKLSKNIEEYLVYLENKKIAPIKTGQIQEYLNDMNMDIAVFEQQRKIFEAKFKDFLLLFEKAAEEQKNEQDAAQTTKSMVEKLKNIKSALDIINHSKTRFIENLEKY